MKRKAVFNPVQKNLILRTCTKEKDKTDMQIAKTLIGQTLFSEYTTKPDTLRRYITFVRDWVGLRPVVQKKEIKKKIDELYRAYGKLNSMQMATKLKLSFPELAITTLTNYVSKYKNYGDF